VHLSVVHHSALTTLYVVLSSKLSASPNTAISEASSAVGVAQPFLTNSVGVSVPTVFLKVLM